MTNATTDIERNNLVSSRATGLGKFQQLIRTASHELIADEPEARGGLDEGPSPYDFLAIALAACTSMTLRLYADRKQLRLPGYSVDVSHDRIHADDCVGCLSGGEGRIDRFTLRVTFDAAVDAAVEAKVLEIAGKCPVHRTLVSSSVIAASVVVAEPSRH